MSVDAEPQIALVISPAALEVLREWNDDYSATDAESLARSLIGLIALGGEVFKESDNMLIAQTRSGPLVGMYRDPYGEVSLNS